MELDEIIKADPSENEEILPTNYDDALNEVGVGKFHALLLLTCGLCLMTTIIETLNIGFVIPLIEMECELDLTLSQKGILNGAAFVGVVMSSFFWGFLADWKRGGRHKIMHICVSAAFIFSVMSSLSINIWILIVTRFFVGFFISGVAANTYAYLAEFHCEKNRAKYMSFAGIFMAFALTFCPAVGWLILTFQNIAKISFNIPLVGLTYTIWRIFLLICAVPSGLVTFLMFFLPESPKFLLAQEKHEEALKILREVYHRNKKTDRAYPVTTIALNELITRREYENFSFFQQIWKQTNPLFKSPLLMKTIKTSFVMFSLFSASSGFFLWTPDILNKLHEYNNENFTVCNVIDEVMKMKELNVTLSNELCHVTPVDATIYKITFMMGAFFSIIYFVNGVIINRVGKRNLLGAWFVLCGVAGGLIPWTADYYKIIFLMLIFLTCGVCGSILSAILVDLFPTNIRAISLCFVLMIGRIGAVIGSIFVSFMIVAHCQLMFGLFAALLLVSALISVLLPGK
ncbi:CLUMA_CG001280, isoform A [Clunio marinus]|uniref:CLUMA_CG001280, isoform A n=1 Tax=Clunio marinus TaxID=568069 RepID=A0A1J1HHH6_9DIPT|nr:CLUMA_CG001280, isoform A [Clunio marinus]